LVNATPNRSTTKNTFSACIYPFHVQCRCKYLHCLAIIAGHRTFAKKTFAQRQLTRTTNAQKTFAYDMFDQKDICPERHICPEDI
jgi:hypothetical protein